ncbi:MAG: helix-turn-helix transcriptional regulator [Actinomycetota bacterium]|nr:helix-turn-helix transcriptional regulator [Actinomycetota bacterium]
MTEPQTVDQLVGKNIQVLRVAKGLSQADLAAAISTEAEHIPQQTIVKIEKGTRPLKYAEALRICAVLGVGLAQLSVATPAAQKNAGYIALTTKLADIQTKLPIISSELAKPLLDLSMLVASDSTADDDEQPDTNLIEAAKSWLHQDWGAELNNMIVLALSVESRRAELPKYLQDMSYIEALERLSTLDPGSYSADS